MVIQPEHGGCFLPLYPFQVDDVDYLDAQPSVLIANEPGTGKTLEAIERDMRIHMHHAGFTLVVCPKSVIGVWEAHYARYAPFTEETIITNWEQLRLHPEWQNVGWLHIIADECHRAKNRKAQQTQALKKLTARYKTALTGTPVINTPDELWSILNWLYPKDKRFSSYWRFFTQFVDYTVASQGFKVIHGPRNTALLREWIKPFTVRRLKEDVLPDLPSKYYCTPENTPIMMSDGTFKPISEVSVGDIVLGWEEAKGIGNKRHLTPCRVLDKGTSSDQTLVKATMASGRSVTCTPGHLWRSGILNTTKSWVQLGPHADRRKNGPKALCFVVEPPRVLTEYEKELALWLGGILDGEGAFYHRTNGDYWSVFQSQSKNPEVHKRIREALTVLGIPFVCDPCRGGDNFRLSTNRDTAVKLLTRCKPVKHRAVLEYGVLHRWFKPDKVVDITPLEGLHETYWLKTETGNYVAWGYASKNSEVPVDLEPRQRRAYDEMKAEMLAWVGPFEDQPLPAPEAVAKLTRLSQLACGYLAYDHEFDRWRLCEPSSKLDALMDLVADRGDPIVVFSQFRQLIGLLEARLVKAGTPYVALTGDTPQQDRDAATRRFQAGDVRLFLGTIAAGGVGITLHAASTVVFLDRSWSPASNLQAEDRLHRIGQKNGVEVIDIMARGTVDRGRQQKLELKANMIREMLDDA